MIRELLGLSGITAACLLLNWPSVAVPSASAQPAAKPLSAELTYVPSDAAIFIHIDVAKLWNGPIARSLREADPKAFEQLITGAKSMFGSEPDSLESLTLFWPKVKNPRDFASFGVVGVFKSPYDKAKLAGGLEKIAENGSKVKILTPTPQMAVMLVGLDEQTYGKPQASKDGPQSAAILEAGSRRHTLCLSVAPGQLPDEIRGDNVPPDVRAFQPLFNAESVSGFISLDKELVVDIRVKATTPPRAKEAEKSLGFLTKLAEEGLERGMRDLRRDAVNDTNAQSLIALMATLQTSVKDARFTTDGESTRVVVKAPADLPFAKAFLAARVKVQQAAASATSANNLKQIALAFHNYDSANNSFPPASVCDKKGKPMLSWRVLILPYIEEDALYKEFKLDEPWDSENNKKLIAKMPRVYAMPAPAKSKANETHYRLFVGNGAGFDYIRGTKITDFADGTSNTILVATAKDSTVWTKPDELEFDPEKDATKLLGFMPGDSCPVAFADGSVRNLTPRISKKTLHAFITRNGGEVVSEDDDR